MQFDVTNRTLNAAAWGQVLEGFAGCVDRGSTWATLSFFAS